MEDVDTLIQLLTDLGSDFDEVQAVTEALSASGTGRWSHGWRPSWEPPWTRATSTPAACSPRS
ncbi:hypothetical protein [Streptomyces sannanensis]